jgi:hypothetical protein
MSKQRVNFITEKELQKTILLEKEKGTFDTNNAK